MFLRQDGTRKPAFTAVKNLITLLEDPQSVSEAKALSFSATGDSQLRTLLLHESDGNFYLLL